MSLHNLAPIIERHFFGNVRHLASLFGDDRHLA